MNLEELLKLLGITEKEALVRRIVDGVVPSVDFVDLGANGQGESGFIVKKGRNMVGTISKDELGNFHFVQPERIAKAKKVPKGNKEALAALMAQQKAALDKLSKAMEDVEEDEESTEMPEEIKAILAEMSKSFGDEPKPIPEPAETPKAEAAPVTKGAEPAPEAKPDDKPADAFDLDGSVLTGGLAQIAKGMTEAAEGIKDVELLGTLKTTLAGMAKLQQRLDPASANTQAMVAVNKRMDSEMADLKKQNSDLTAKLDAIMASGFLGMAPIKDGAPTAEPTQKGAKNGAFSLPVGQDIGSFVGRDDFNFGAKE